MGRLNNEFHKLPVSPRNDSTIKEDDQVQPAEDIESREGRYPLPPHPRQIQSHASISTLFFLNRLFLYSVQVIQTDHIHESTKIQMAWCKTGIAVPGDGDILVPRTEGYQPGALDSRAFRRISEINSAQVPLLDGIGHIWWSYILRRAC